MANQEWKRNANETGALLSHPLHRSTRTPVGRLRQTPTQWPGVSQKRPTRSAKFDSTRTAQFFARSAKRGCFPASLIGEVMQTNPADANPIERRFKLCLTIPPI